MDRPEKIGVDLRAKVLDAGVFDRAEVSVAGHIRHHVQPAEAFDRRVHRGLRRAKVGHIEWPQDHLGGVPIGQVLKAAGVSGCGDEIVAGAEHRFGECVAEAANFRL